MLDLIISGGRVWDGTGAPEQALDIGIRGDRIEDVGNLSRAEAKETIRADGCMVNPGFIDVHSHSDAYLLIEPGAHSKIYQGITTEVVGNCGASAGPRFGPARMPSDWQEQVYPGEWSTVAEYRGLLEQVRPAPNAYLLIGHNTLRASVMGYENRAPSPEEMADLHRHLDQALAEGGRGLSTGLVYAPGMFAATEEIAELARTTAARGGIYTSHMRSEGARLWEAVDEALDIGRRSGARVQISHLKTSGPAHWSKLDGALERIERARASGLDVASDRYPYIASCTDLDVMLPDWAAEGSRAEIIGRLRDPSQRARILDALLSGHDAGYWSRVTIGSTRHPDHSAYAGCPLEKVAEAMGLEPAEAALTLMEKDELATGGIFFGMSEENMWRILAQSWVMLGSDGSLRAPTGPLSRDHPHPRNYGAFTRFLRAALDGRTVSLAEAIRKMTSLPADHFQMRDRGRIRRGAFADIIVWNPDTVRDRAEYARPHQLSEGMQWIVVNGAVTLRHGQLTGRRAGRVLDDA
ncbi:MAG: D-aminoacylase [Kiritimatiellae bacterium]|nr:D-aminoacylase [Kiritimatiellia bacterium]